METTSILQIKPLPPSTIQIMEQLNVGKKQTFQEVVLGSKYSSNNVKKRLKELKKIGYINFTKEGRIIYYSISKMGKEVLDLIRLK
jgi:predicted transcriptional regulator